MLKKLAGILLIAVLILPFVSSFFFLQYQKKQVKKSIKHNLMGNVKRNELVKLVFTKEETQTKLKWEHSKEFEFNGKMYDIVESVEKNNIITYYCWLDKEETELNNKLNNLLYYALGHDKQSETNQKKLKKFAQSIFTPQENIKIYLYQKEIFLKAEMKSSNYKSIKLDVINPPPQSLI